jgi:hypothetical protein
LARTAAGTTGRGPRARSFFRHVTEPQAVGLPDRVALPPDLSPGRAHDPHHRAHRGGLARSVPADQPDDLALADAHREVVNGDALPEAVDDVRDLQHGRTHEKVISL